MDIFMTVMCCMNYQKTLQSWSHFKSDQVLYIQSGSSVHSVWRFGAFSLAELCNCDVEGISGRLIMIDIDSARYKFIGLDT